MGLSAFQEPHYQGSDDMAPLWLRYFLSPVTIAKQIIVAYGHIVASIG